MRYYPPDEKVGKHHLALVHVAKAKLCLDDDSYRAVLFDTAKVPSAKDLTHEGFKRVMKRFEELGFKAASSPSPSSPPAGGGDKRVMAYREPVTGKKRVRGSKEHPVDPDSMATPEQQAAIWWMWKTFARVPTQEALRNWIKNKHRVDDIRFLTRYKAQAAIEALKAMFRRTNPDWDGVIECQGGGADV